MCFWQGFSFNYLPRSTASLITCLIAAMLKAGLNLEAVCLFQEQFYTYKEIKGKNNIIILQDIKDVSKCSK
jgi:hypothetical protein